MMLYAAIDIHKRMFQAAVLDVETGETVERRFGATREELNDWAMPLQGKLAAVAIEATNGWRRGCCRSRGCRRPRSRRCATRPGCARPSRRTALVGRSGCTRC